MKKFLSCLLFASLVVAHTHAMRTKIIKRTEPEEESIAIDHKQLIIATKKHDFELVKNLLDLKANVNFRNNRGSTALHKAARRDSLKFVELLLD